MSPTTPMTGTALLPSALPSSLGAASPSGPSSTTLEVFHSIVKGRKSWKTLRGNGEAVWPPELEAALLEGLESYQPDDSRETRLLGRFPMRNRYISDYIWKVTGKRRTAKQVGSRLQQLRDTCGGKRLLALLSPCKRQVPAHRSTPALMREQQRGGALDDVSSSPFSSASAPSSSPSASTTTTSPLVICIDLLPPSSPLPAPASAPSTPVQDSTGTFHAAQPRPIKSIDPTVTFLSQQHIDATSHYTVYQQQHQGHGENAVVFSESTPLVLVPNALPAGDGETLVYSTALVPGFWSEIADAHDPTHYTIHQEIIKQVPSSSSSLSSPTSPTSPSSLSSPSSPTSPSSPAQAQSAQVLMFSAIYKFKFAEPAAHFSLGMGMGMGMSLYDERPSTSSSSTSLDSLDSMDSMDSMDSFASYTTDATHSTTPTSTSSSPTVHPRSLSSPTAPSSPSSPTSPTSPSSASHTHPSTPSPTSRTHTNKISLPLPPSLSLSLPLPLSPSQSHQPHSALSPSSPPPTASTSASDEAFDYFLPVDIDVTQFVADPFSAHSHPSQHGSAQLNQGYMGMSNMGMGNMGMGGMGMGMNGGMMDINGMLNIDYAPSSAPYMDAYAHTTKHNEESFYELSSEPGVYDSANAGWGIGGHHQQSQVHEQVHQHGGHFGQEYSTYVL
ncbi:hypothetical protein CCMSSC00406_0008331 [Pleurotus cornucopiae]|uniref:Uncharacterized protein n=1 Tax=Pleurotus cornucopiae TaxID=5321 RepID=A0ACB7IV72_PLECO|nr:hypothetical protein CCMSSC00406_0008331 [Pleurotus cornucopiae]